MARSEVDINVNELAPMDNPEDAVPLNIKALHDTLVLTQEKLRLLEKKIEENHP